MTPKAKSGILDAMKLKVQRIDSSATMPSYAHDGDACFDLSILIDYHNAPMTVNAATGELTDNPLAVDGMSVMLHPHETMVFHTGLKFETERGYNMKMYVRSSTGIKKNLVLSNGTGVIDTAQYRGEVLIGLTNVGDSVQKVCDGERVAQAEIVKTLDVEIEEVDELSSTERGESGIGSTGGH